MLKRIAIVAFFTGSGQLLSVFVLKFISQYAEVEQLKNIAEIDSLVFFMMNVIALGLQVAAIRDLAHDDQWEQHYRDTQSARITLGLLLMSAALLSFINPFYLVFLTAPVFAWSGDYALYARGHAVMGAFISFLRLVIPFSALLLAAHFQLPSLAWVYIISLVVVYVLTNAFISYFLKTAYVFRISFKKLRLYVDSLPLGIVALSLYFLGLGLLLIVPYFYEPPVVAVVFAGMKFYIVFKGVLRIMHQAFLKEMQSPLVSLRVDQLSAVAGIVFFGSVILFPEAFISFFFGRQYLHQQYFFMILGADGLIYAVFLSFATRAVFDKADKKYTIISAAAALTAIVAVMILSKLSGSAISIGIALGIGELVWAIGLIILFATRSQVKDRLVYLAGLHALLLVPLAVRLLLHDSLLYYCIGFGLFCLLILILHYRKFKTLSYATHNTSQT